MQETVLSATEVLSIWRVLSKVRGLTLISPPALCHSWWFRLGSVSAGWGWGVIPSTTLLDYKTSKSQVIHVCVCYKWSDFIRYGRFLHPTLQVVGVSIDLENLLRLSFLVLLFLFFCFFCFLFFWCSPFSGHWFSTTPPFLCPKAINRKQNIGKWSKKSYLFPYQSPVSWVTWAGCIGVLSLVVLT